MPEKTNDRKSLRMMIASLLIVGTIGAVRRRLPFSSGLLAFVRGALGAASLTLYCMLRRRRLFHSLPKKTLGLLLLSGAVLGVNWIMLFEAYRYTTVAIATLCYYCEPILLMLLSPLLFGEKLTGRRLLCAAVAVTGMILVTGVGAADTLGSGHWRGVAFGLAGAVFYALVVIINKKLPPVDAYEKTVFQLFFAALTMLPYLLLTEDLSSLSVTGTTLALLLVIGVVYTGLVYILYFGSMGGLRAQTIAILSYLDPVVALLTSALLLGERMTPLGLLGALMILGAAVFSEK